ncbi:protein of unknown function [Paraburkholderia kururiensis]
MAGTARRERWTKSSKSRAVSGFDRLPGSSGMATFSRAISGARIPEAATLPYSIAIQ